MPSAEKIKTSSAYRGNNSILSSIDARDGIQITHCTVLGEANTSMGRVNAKHCTLTKAAARDGMDLDACNKRSGWNYPQ